MAHPAVPVAAAQPGRLDADDRAVRRGRRVADGLDGRHPPERLVDHGAHAAGLEGHNPAVDNAQIADRLDALAVLLELSEANPYTIRAYRRAADVIRDAAVPVAGLVQRRPRARAARDRPGHRGAAARAGRDRATSPSSPSSSASSAARAGRRSAASSGSARERVDRDRAGAWASGPPRSCARRRPQGACGGARASARRPRRGSSPRSRATPSRARSAALLLNRARELVDAIAAALGGTPAGDARRWRDACERLAVVVAARRSGAASWRASPPCPRSSRCSSGRAAGRRRHRRRRPRSSSSSRRPSGSATALLRATGAPAYVDALEPLPDGARRGGRVRGARRPLVPAGDARGAVPRRAARRSWSSRDIRGDLHCHTTWSDGRAIVLEDEARARAIAATSTSRSATTRRRVGVVPGLDAGRRPPPGRGDRRRERAARAVPRPARGRVRHPPGRARSTSPTTCSPSSTGCRPASTAASGCRARR